MKPATLETANAIPLLRTLGIRLREVGEKHAIMDVTVDDRHCNYFGGAHGGLLATLVDTVCFFPKPFLPSGRKVTTANLVVNYVRTAQVGDHLTSRSDILHSGRRTASLQVRVTNQQDQLVVHGSALLVILEEPPEA